MGDESLLDGVNDFSELPNIFPIFLKTNWDGKKIKSISSTLRDSRGKAIGLLCINLNLSKWEEFYHFLGLWLNDHSESEKPSLLFKDDWREKINEYVSNYLINKKTTLKNLGKEKKRDLVIALYKEGAFNAKNAANYIADVLALSRATVYNYLKGMDE